MKKVIAIVLIFALSIFLYARVSSNVKNLLEEQRELKRANQLFDTGYYEYAIDAYMSIDSYSGVVKRIEKAEKQLAKEAAYEEKNAEEKNETVYTRAEVESVTYTWYVKDPGSNEWIESSVTTATYSCNMTPEKSGRQVYCVITDAQGNMVTSEITTLIYTDEEE